ncbi:DUF3093 domain-containing protein [Glaciihabitans sp. dw_435]|uniref:DUF3093 domain-containing protein n=1 Tax=Glaciihabitans sp. dw_435 TaxID=2720081 RepID=UPI001BD6DFC5|nr:DUF3093 domain-containing protein [Glaciihabitans sp. dw_435]
MTTYRERLLPGPWQYIASALIIPAALLVFLPINAEVGVWAAAILFAASVLVLTFTSPVIEVSESALIAGRARLPIENVGAMNGFTKSEATLERGQRLDARAWLVIRGWVDPVVKVEIRDERDPAPYWLVSTRQPEALMRAIDQARARL